MNKPVLIALCCLLPCLLKAQSTPASAGMQTGKLIYVQRCATCHQQDGAGAQNMIPPLIKTEYVLGDKARLIAILLNGLKGEMTVDGNIYGNEMPAQADLRDSEIAAVLTFVRNNFGNKASAVSTKAVQQVRASNKQ